MQNRSLAFCDEAVHFWNVSLNVYITEVEWDVVAVTLNWSADPLCGKKMNRKCHYWLLLSLLINTKGATNISLLWETGWIIF